MHVKGKVKEGRVKEGTRTGVKLTFYKSIEGSLKDKRWVKFSMFHFPLGIMGWSFHTST